MKKISAILLALLFLAVHGAALAGDIAPVETLTWSGSTVRLETWGPLAAGETCLPCNTAGLYPQKTVMVSGTFGGATVTLYGNNIVGGSTWAQLTTDLGNGIAFAAAGLVKIRENPLAIKPVVSGGDGTTNLTITVMMAGGQS